MNKHLYFGSSVGSFFSYVNDVRSHEPEAVMLIAILSCRASSLDDGRPTFTDQHAVSGISATDEEVKRCHIPEQSNLNYPAAKLQDPQQA